MGRNDVRRQPPLTPLPKGVSPSCGIAASLTSLGAPAVFIPPLAENGSNPLRHPSLFASQQVCVIK